MGFSTGRYRGRRVNTSNRDNQSASEILNEFDSGKDKSARAVGLTLAKFGRLVSRPHQVFEIADDVRFKKLLEGMHARWVAPGRWVRLILGQ